MEGSQDSKFRLLRALVELYLDQEGHPSVSLSKKLDLYAYEAQTSHGNCVEEEPEFMDVVDRKRWSTWKRLVGMDKVDSRNKYIETALEVIGGEEGWLVSEVGPDIAEYMKIDSVEEGYIQYRRLEDEIEEMIEAIHQSLVQEVGEEWMEEVEESKEEMVKTIAALEALEERVHKDKGVSDTHEQMVALVQRLEVAIRGLEEARVRADESMARRVSDLEAFTEEINKTLQRIDESLFPWRILMGLSIVGVPLGISLYFSWRRGKKRFM